MTHNEIDALTEEQVHKAVLERLGWSLIRPGLVRGLKGCFPRPTTNFKECPPLDDNLMREARKLLDSEQAIVFIATLCSGSVIVPGTYEGAFKLIHVPALDHARAFLKTMALEK
jgi:hypothetical protein